MEWISFVLLWCAVLGATDLVSGQVERRTGNVCKTDTECPDNAWCRASSSGTAGYCVCKEGYLIQPFNATHRECLKEASSVGDACREHIQCQLRLSVHALCVEGACACKDGAHLDQGRCYETALIGQKCMVTQNCYLGPDGETEYQAFCVRGICTCQLLHSPRDGGTRCVRDAGLGEGCEDAEQCVGGGLQCLDGMCRCQRGWVAHTTDPRCLEVSPHLNASCEADTQCAVLGVSDDLALCSGGTCACGWDARESRGRCWHRRALGHDCQFDEECEPSNGIDSTCLQGACTCLDCPVEFGGLNTAIQQTYASTILLTLLCCLYYGLH